MIETLLLTYSSLSLFMIHEDPALPAFVFEMALEKMLEETCSNFVEEGNEDNNVPQPLGGKMADLFLETLRSWGNTSALRKR